MPSECLLRDVLQRFSDRVLAQIVDDPPILLEVAFVDNDAQRDRPLEPNQVEVETGLVLPLADGALAVVANALQGPFIRRDALVEEQHRSDLQVRCE